MHLVPSPRVPVILIVLILLKNPRSMTPLRLKVNPKNQKENNILTYAIPQCKHPHSKRERWGHRKRNWGQSNTENQQDKHYIL
jgi:hypothetical protein